MRQREILRRLRLVRCVHLPDLWHTLSGDLANPWPNPGYQGGLSGRGQSLALYGRGSTRSVRVAYRRAALSLQRAGQLQVRYGEGPVSSAMFYVRLPMTGREEIAARGLRRRIAAYRDADPSTRHEGRDRELVREGWAEYVGVMKYFSSLGRYPPLEKVPPAAAAILRQGISGHPVRRHGPQLPR
ncbi:hypothetical protein DFR71_6233 [Nocardia alba]|uniref:Uncharacterized protein n=1 Tax=Nocardia alba TaxID=225051 RepID=A0A4R1F7M2_9NOCA|nr:hypothetical protein DFR71_6233 [Nocardia alba]